MTKMHALLVGVVLLAASGSVSARELAGVSLPDRVDVGGRSLVLNGMGIREATFLNVKVYVAGLYLEKRSSDATRTIESAQVKRLVLQFVRDVKRSQIIDAWDEGFRKNSANVGALRARIQKLDGWMADCSVRDNLTFTYEPGSGLEVRVNGVVKGSIEGDDFARGFFSIWLGPEPPNASLKAGLLGGQP